MRYRNLQNYLDDSRDELIMIKQLFTLLLLTWLAGTTIAQIGGEHVYEFINLPHNARATALGEYLIATSDGDLGAAYHNPASLTAEADQQVQISYDLFLSDISRGSLAYGFTSEKLKANLHAGLQFVNYGDFKQTNTLGIVEGDFSVKDIALTLGGSRDLYERLRVGANIRLINSQYESYTSWGLTFDAAALFHVDEKNTILTLVIKNAGTQLSTFADERESVPFDIQAGFSRRLEHLPFRFSIIAHHLHQWDIVYDDPDRRQVDNIFGTAQPTDNTGFIEDLFRHLVFSGEMYIGKNENVKLRLAYNHLRAKELKLDDFRTLAGFSFGLGIKLGKIQVDYGFGKFHTEAAASHFTLSTNLDKLFGQDTEL